MIFNTVSINPEFIKFYFQFGINAKAMQEEIFKLNYWNPLNYCGKKRLDDSPYGGGRGMILSYPPMKKIMLEIQKKNTKMNLNNSISVLMSPQGKLLNKKLTNELINFECINIISSRYEGLDQRFINECIDLEVSIGNYVLSSGELPLLILIDSLVRLLPNAIGNQNEFHYDSFDSLLLGYPQYTRPQTVNNQNVPEILLSGNLSQIHQWKKEQSFFKTLITRPDLIYDVGLSEKEYNYLLFLKNYLVYKNWG